MKLRSPHIHPRQLRDLVATIVCAAVLALACSNTANAAATARAVANANANAANNADAAATAAPVDYSDRTVTFNASMLAGKTAQHANLGHYEKPQLVAPGLYNIDVFLNRQWLGRFDVRFAAPHAGAHAVACMSPTLIKRMQVPGVTAKLDANQRCVTLEQLVAGATTTFDLGRLRLNATIPQAILGTHARGYVSPSSWAKGIPAFMLNYDLSGYQSRHQGFNQTSVFLGLNAGLNIGLWHMRADSVLTHEAASGQPSTTHWHTIDAYVSRDLPSWHSRLTLGDISTDGAVFDSLSLRGIRLSSVDQMRPASRRGFAPVLHGVAHSNAKVTVRRDGNVIYQTTVPPGPFTIDDIYASGSGGALAVTVTEADGNKHTFTVPFASVGQLVRPGVLRYDFDAGKLRNTSFIDTDAKQTVLRGTVQYGFNNYVTGYGGFQGTQGYASAVVGAAFNTPIGALALDVTEAGVSLPGYIAHDGQSVRATWSQAFAATHTRINVAAYRYSTRGFLSLRDAVGARDYARSGVNTYQNIPDLPRINGRIDYAHLSAAQRASLDTQGYDPVFDARGLLHQRNRFTLSVNQQLGDGSLYATASFNDYWNRHGNNRSYQVSYSNHVGSASWSLTASRAYNPYFGGYDERAFLSISIPLGRAAYSPRFMLNLAHNNRGNTTEQAVINGIAGSQHQFSWGANATYGNHGNETSGGVSAGYRGAHAVIRASAAGGNGFSQTSASLNGGILISHAGVLFSQPLGNTVALVHAPGAAGAHVGSSIGLRVGKNGYAVVPYLQPYQVNTIHLNPKGMSLGAQLESTDARIAPYAGAVVEVNFKTAYGRALIVKIAHANDTAVPFGTPIRDAKNRTVGVVGQGGRALLRVHHRSGQLALRWSGNNDKTHGCGFSYAFPKTGDNHSRTPPQVTVTCLPSAKH